MSCYLFLRPTLLGCARLRASEALRVGPWKIPGLERLTGYVTQPPRLFRNSSTSSDSGETKQRLRIDITEEYARKKLANLSESENKRLKMYKLELEVHRGTGEDVPNFVPDTWWCYFLESDPNRTTRLRHFQLLYKKASRKRDRQENRQDQASFQNPNHERRQYDIPYISTRHLSRVRFGDIIHAATFGPNIIFDFGFDHHREEVHFKNAGRQFSLCHHVNTCLSTPFHIHITGLEPDSISSKYLYYNIKGFDDIPYTVTEKSYLDFYEKDELIYLSPEAPDVMREYDATKTYIIGGLTDTRDSLPYSWAKAKRQKITALRLPLDEFLIWKHGPKKSLGTNHVFRILAMLSEGKDWREALLSLPDRYYQRLRPYQGDPFKKRTRHKRIRTSMDATEAIHILNNTLRRK